MSAHQSLTAFFKAVVAHCDTASKASLLIVAKYTKGILYGKFLVCGLDSLKTVQMALKQSGSSKSAHNMYASIKIVKKYYHTS